MQARRDLGPNLRGTWRRVRRYQRARPMLESRAESSSTRFLGQSLMKSPSAPAISYWASIRRPSSAAYLSEIPEKGPGGFNEHSEHAAGTTGDGPFPGWNRVVRKVWGWRVNFLVACGTVHVRTSPRVAAMFLRWI